MKRPGGRHFSSGDAVTKLVTLRVVIPADDVVPIGAVQARLRAIVEDAGMERLPRDENAAPGDTAGRVHWSAADVLQGADRPNGARATQRAARPPKPTVPGQGELA